VIFAGPGDYIEDIFVKPNVYIYGTGSTRTRLGSGATTIALDPSWNHGTSVGFDDRSGFQDLTMAAGTQVFNFSNVSSQAGKLNFILVTINNLVTVATASASSSINQVSFQDTIFFVGINQIGLTVSLYGSIGVNGASFLVQDTIDSDTTFEALASSTNGDVNIATTTNRILQAEFSGMTIRNLFVTNVGGNPLSIQGGSMTGNADISSASVATTNVKVNGIIQGTAFIHATQGSIVALLQTVNGGATVTSSPGATCTVTYAGAQSTVIPPVGVGSSTIVQPYPYNPTNLTAWSGSNPLTVQTALDRIAAAIGVIP
jgi:hypothetical protein